MMFRQTGALHRSGVATGWGEGRRLAGGRGLAKRGNVARPAAHRSLDREVASVRPSSVAALGVR
jgi:hypothetical protein